MRLNAADTIGSNGDGVTAPYNQPNSPTPQGSGKKLNFLGWAVLLLGLYALNGTSWGHEIMFYSMVLIVLFLFIYNYKQILSKLTK